MNLIEQLDDGQKRTVVNLVRRHQLLTGEDDARTFERAGTVMTVTGEKLAACAEAIADGASFTSFFERVGVDSSRAQSGDRYVIATALVEQCIKGL